MIAVLASARPARVRALLDRLGSRDEIVLVHADTYPVDAVGAAGRTIPLDGDRFEAARAEKFRGAWSTIAMPLMHAHPDRLEYRNVDDFIAAAAAPSVLRFFSHGLLVEEKNRSLENARRFHDEAERRFAERRAARIAELAEFTGEDAGTVLRRCEGAIAEGFRRWEEANPAGAEDIVDFYRRNDFYLYQLTRSNFYEGGRTEYVDEAWGFVGAGARLLEIGPGAGDVALALAARGALVTTLDVNPRLLEFIRFKALRRSISLGTTIDWPDGPIDAALAFDVLEHVPDPVATVKALIERLADRGRLLLRLPDEEEDVPMHFTGVRPKVEAYLKERGFVRLVTVTDLDVFERRSAPEPGR